jgi:ribosomal protein S18 acetylase RimI-like enzyme
MPFPPSPPAVTCRRADLHDPSDAAATVALLHAYALDQMGGGQGLTPQVQACLPQALARRPGVHVLLAFTAQEAVGVAVCIEGFSTFACRPLLNLHDLAVLPGVRRRGVGRALLQAVEALALELGCCKLTLEVLSGNVAAQAAYRAAGFAHYRLDPALGQALFWQKALPSPEPPG